MGNIADERVNKIFGRRKLNQRVVTDLAAIQRGTWLKTSQSSETLKKDWEALGITEGKTGIVKNRGMGPMFENGVVGFVRR